MTPTLATGRALAAQIHGTAVHFSAKRVTTVERPAPVDAVVTPAARSAEVWTEQPCAAERTGQADDGAGS